MSAGARGLALALAVVSIVVTGCGDRQEAHEAPGLAPSTEAQPDRPRIGRSAVALIERFRLAPQGRWSDARDVAVDSDGRFYVLDGVVPARILKFDADGSYMLRFGENEPDAPQVVLAKGMSLAPGWNTLLLVDPSESSVSSFLTLGMATYSVKFTGGIPIDAVGMPQFGEYYLQAWDQVRSRSGVYHMRLPGDTLATTYEVTIPLDQPVRKMARDIYFHVAADSGGRLYVAFHDGYPVRVLEPSGATVRRIGIDRPPVAKAPAAIASETAEDLEKLRREAPDLPDSLLVEAARAEAVLPMIEQLAVDPSGRLWVRTNRTDAVGTTPYDVFDKSGHYLARIDVPGDIRATRFGPDGNLVVIDGAADPAGAVVRYEVRLEGGAPAAPRDSAP